MRVVLSVLLLVLLGGDAMAAGKTDYCEMLKGKFPFAGEMTSMSDLASSCSVAGDGWLGINELFLSPNRKHLLFTDAMCRVEIATVEDGQLVPVEGSLESHHYPHGLEQILRGNGIECRAFTCFDALNTPVVHLEVKSARECEVVVSLTGHVPERSGASGSYKFDRSSGILYIRRTEKRTDERDPSPTFTAWAAVQPGFRVRDAVLADSPPALGEPGQVRHDGQRLHYRLTSEPESVTPGSSLRTHAALVFNTHEPRFGEWAFARLRDVVADIDEAESRARERWNDTFHSAPEPKTDDPGRRVLYYQSIYVLMRNLHYPTGRFGTYHASFPSKDHYNANWLWDGSFHAVGYAEFAPDLARESVLLFIENQQSDGRLPHFVTPGWIRPGTESQPPVLAWAAWRVYQRSKDIQFLRRVYGPLAKNTEWWLTARDREMSGLLGWAERYESGWDTSPRWDEFEGKMKNCDLNAFVLMQMNVLVDMAKELGKESDARRWRAEADKLGSRMVEKLYSEKDNLFFDIRVDTGEHTGVLTPASFLPLWAGAPLERDKAEAIIRDYLLSPDYFFGRIPFPVVAYNNPKYNPADYWRGPTWVNISYFMVETLWKYGFHKEADEAADRLLDMMAGNRYIHEYYNSQTGEGLGVKQYGWTAAFSMEMLLWRYRE